MDPNVNEGVLKLKAELNRRLFHKNRYKQFEDKDCLPVLDKIGKDFMKLSKKKATKGHVHD